MVGVSWRWTLSLGCRTVPSHGTCSFESVHTFESRSPPEYVLFTFPAVGCTGIAPDAVLEGGHTEQIRAFKWMGLAIATGGEDAKICSWRLLGEDGRGDAGLVLGNGGGVDAMDDDDAR